MSATADTTRLPLTAVQLLEALEGVAYLVDPDGSIVAVGQRGWSGFAAENAAPWLTVEAVVGTSLFAAIRDDAVRDVYQRLHEAVVARRRDQIVFDYRCDSPLAERHMRMALTPVAGPDVVIAVLYQSQMVAEVPRLPLPMFSSDARAMARRVTRPDPDRMVVVCSFCQRVAWPLGERGRARRWIAATEFYRRGGPADAVVSDGVCPACVKRVVEPNA